MKDPRVTRLLELVTKDASLEDEWLDLLSQLEYVGCRKILKSVGFEKVDQTTLQHVAEEASHAFLLKAQTSTPGATWQTRPLSRLGWLYFQTLDQEISALEGAEETAYPAVSYAIEQRVLQIYPEYLEATKNDGVRAVVRQIMAQEKRHGEQFSGNAFREEFRRKMLSVEGRLWDGFLGAMTDYFQSQIALRKL